MTTPEDRDAPVKQVLENRGWKLVSDLAPFVQSVYEQVQSKSFSNAGQFPARAIQRATIHQYCFILYAACLSGGQRQTRAFEELGQHLYRVALFKTHDPELAKDCTQQALENIWRHLDSCRDHGAFLDWCHTILVHVIYQEFRNRMKQPTDEADKEWKPIEVSSDDEDHEVTRSHEEFRKRATTDGSEVVTGAMHTELRDQLLDALRACLKNEDHVTVIMELLLNDKTFLEVAEQLHTTVGNVRTIKSRALDRLRVCEDLIDLYEEWVK